MRFPELLCILVVRTPACSSQGPWSPQSLHHPVIRGACTGSRSLTTAQDMLSTDPHGQALHTPVRGQRWLLGCGLCEEQAEMLGVKAEEHSSLSRLGHRDLFLV